MNRNLSHTLNDPQQGVYFIGTTPPRAGTKDDKMAEIAEKLLGRLSSLEYDGVIVYDIQDESSRIDQPRPFPFMETRDPREYAYLLSRLSGRDTITYKSVAQRDRHSFEAWLQETHEKFSQQHLVLVGAPSSEGQIQLSLQDAYEALRDSKLPFNLGGVTIAERHAVKGNEHLRLMQKGTQGCSFFVSQAVYNPQATIDLLTSYARECRARGESPKRIILTFTPCGSQKTLEFMNWLGISVPEATRWRILDAPSPLSESIRICQNSLEQILEACLPLGLPLGLNIESLTNRKEEIDASIALFRLLKARLELSLAERALV